MLALADRKPGFRRLREPEQVLIPIGYRASVSVEAQAEGMFLHLSISVERADPKWMPSPQSVEMIARAFGFDPDVPAMGNAWLEEYEQGRYAVNLLRLIEARTEGHA